MAIECKWAPVQASFPHHFSACCLNLHRPWPPFILKQASYVKGNSEPSHVCGGKPARGWGSVYWAARCDQLRITRPAFIWTHQNQAQTSQLSHTSHGAKQSSLFLRLSPFLSFCLTFIHFLMCDTLILNILFPVFWSIGFTCRWAGNLHRLKGLPSLLMLSDNGVSIHPLCSASLPGHQLNCCLTLLQVSFYTAGTAVELD